MAIQPSILKYKNGDLQTLGRTRNTVLYQSWSKDGGKTWSEMTTLDMPITIRVRMQ
ncbi:exo-alpha-sialidase [Niabella hibiscisoli]|nr:exo-alpha-sialidase [Niabella hibiscisoli]MCH5720209.1 exo-alpha-sialidase [Niabella hibiscisoli]